MKLTSTLACASLAALVAALAGLVLNLGALGFFAAAASTLVALVAVADYQPARFCGAAVLATARRRERMPLAA